MSIHMYIINIYFQIYFYIYFLLKTTDYNYKKFYIYMYLYM